ncbi:MAG: DJ-1 family glyoxalase III [Lachnospirales bacterium]
MKKIGVFLVEGFEPIEAIGIIDVLRRGKCDVEVISLTRELEVDGAHGIKLICDKVSSKEEYFMMVMPGGKGTQNYLKCYEFLDYLKEHSEENKYIAAICAAPTVLDKLGILKNKKYTCYPSLKSQVKTSNNFLESNVVIDGHLITSAGPGTTLEFALKILEIVKDKDVAKEVAAGLLL